MTVLNTIVIVCDTANLKLFKCVVNHSSHITVLDYALQQQNLTFIKTHELVEKKAVVVRINDDRIVESGAPEYFSLTLHSVGPASKVVFPTKEISISIVDDD